MGFKSIEEMRVALQKRQGMTDEEIEHDKLIRILSRQQNSSQIADFDEVLKMIRKQNGGSS